MIVVVVQGGVRVIVVVVAAAWPLQHREPDTALAFKTPAGNHGEAASIIAGSSWCKQGECWEQSTLVQRCLRGKVQRMSSSKVFK